MSTTIKSPLDHYIRTPIITKLALLPNNIALTTITKKILSNYNHHLTIIIVQLPLLDGRYHITTITWLWLLSLSIIDRLLLHYDLHELCCLAINYYLTIISLMMIIYFMATYGHQISGADYHYQTSIIK